MKLKMSYDSEADIPDGFNALFTETDGKWNFTGVEGMPSADNVTRLTTSLNKEREAHKATKTRLSAFSDKSDDEITEILGKLDRFDELEAASGEKLDDDKINEIADKRAAAKTAPLQREIDKLAKDNSELTETNTALNGEKIKRTIHDAIREAATKEKVLPAALEDALMLAERTFEVGEDGKVIARDNVGVTPGIDPGSWLTDLKEKRPHWWPTSQGGGADPQNSGANSGNNPWAADSFNLTEQGRVFRENPEKARNLAKMAGAKVPG